MKLRIGILAALLVTSGASAKKYELSIEIVAAQADCIVVGEIVAVEADSYQFRVTDYVKGSGSRLLTVQQFKEWTCDVRFAKAAPGQRLFLFLQHRNNALEIINGSTGEIPVVNNQLTLEHETYHFRVGQPFVPYSIGLTEFRTGIATFTHCFQLPKSAGNPYSRALVQTCGAKEVARFASTSNFTKWLYKRINDRYTITMR
ncbi:hypothetical protein ACFST9_18500 [Hymenobacter monticola]|uniref:Uncharacterized protein n=1 Tax=Hymenobacter monticola TaxID=1705399 RepID=A0ABY4AZG4_9BACT|nr:hypothetical protein [Hymenobacter monticola]UOE32100.1 hypothetical protein MTP16_13265 [Hymenobacter monticola]